MQMTVAMRMRLRYWWRPLTSWSRGAPVVAMQEHARTVAKR